MKGFLAASALVLTSVAHAEPAAQIAGRVSWLSGSSMTVGVPVQQFGQRGSVTLDLSEVPQADLVSIRSGDHVVIYGEWIDGRFIATRVMRAR